MISGVDAAKKIDTHAMATCEYERGKKWFNQQTFYIPESFCIATKEKTTQ